MSRNTKLVALACDVHTEPSYPSYTITHVHCPAVLAATTIGVINYVVHANLSEYTAGRLIAISSAWTATALSVREVVASREFDPSDHVMLVRACYHTQSDQLHAQCGLSNSFNAVEAVGTGSATLAELPPPHRRRSFRKVGGGSVRLAAPPIPPRSVLQGHRSFTFPRLCVCVCSFVRSSAIITCAKLRN